MAEEHSTPHVNYFNIFLILLGCTLVSALADVIDLKNHAVLVVIVLAVATAKALFVMGYFMHLKFEGNWKFILLLPTIILALGIPMALFSDISLHYYDDLAQQQNFIHDQEEFSQAAGVHH